MSIGEIHIGVNWDDTALPQLMVSISVQSVDIPLAQDMLHFLYLIADEYTQHGPPDFYNTMSQFEGDFQWTDLLRYLPNPTGEPLPDRITGHTVVSMLPTYAIGLLWPKVTLTLRQNAVEVAQLIVSDTSLVLEHQIRSAHIVVAKFSVRDLFMTCSPRGRVIDRHGAEGLLFALRIEDEVGDAVKPAEKRLAALKKEKDKSGVLIDKVNELEKAAVAALTAATAAEQANTVASTFVRVRNYLQNRKMFRKNGLVIEFGVVNFLLNFELFATLASFFTADATATTRQKLELLRLTSEASNDAFRLLALLKERGNYHHIADTEYDISTGLYGVPASQAPLARVPAQPPTPKASGGFWSSAPKKEAVAEYELSLPSENAALKPFEKALISLDRLTAMLGVLEHAANELDRQQLIIGNPVSTPGKPPGTPATLTVPVSSLNFELRRRGNEKLQSQWASLRKTIDDTRAEKDKLRRLIALEWPGATFEEERNDSANYHDDNDDLPPVAVLSLSANEPQNTGK